MQAAALSFQSKDPGRQSSFHQVTRPMHATAGNASCQDPSARVNSMVQVVNSMVQVATLWLVPNCLVHHASRKLPMLLVISRCSPTLVLAG
jgi:hypothetical protein